MHKNNYTIENRKEVKLEQGSTEWLDYRLNKYTGTLVAKMAKGNFFNKTILKSFSGISDFIGNEATYHGHEQEAHTRENINKNEELFFNFVPKVIEADLMVNNKVYKCLASLDGIDELQECILEVKSPLSVNSKLLSINDELMHQIQFYLMVTGLQICFYTLNFNVKAYDKKIHRDEKIIKSIVDNIIKFDDAFTQYKKRHPIMYEEAYIKLKEEEKEIKRKLDAIKLNYKNNIGDNNVMFGNSIVVKKVIRKSTGYKKACEEKNINLTDYTKEKESISISIID